MLWLEAVMAGIMLVGLVGVLCERVKRKKGIGVRSIQFLFVAIAVPAVVILALEGVLSSEGVSALLGVLIGYMLFGFAKEAASKASKESGNPEEADD